MRSRYFALSSRLVVDARMYVRLFFDAYRARRDAYKARERKKKRRMLPDIACLPLEAGRFSFFSSGLSAPNRSLSGLKAHSALCK